MKTRCSVQRGIGARIGRMTVAVALALPLLALEVGVDRLQSDRGLTSSLAAVAQEAQRQQQETRKTPALRNNIYEKLSEAQTAAEEKDYATANKVLNDLIASRGNNALNSYELANVYNLQAFIRYSEEDFDGALRSYQEVVKQPDIPLAMEINTRFTVAQLHFVQENWREGVDELLRWFAMSENPSAQAYILLGQGYYQMQDFDKALVNTKKAVDMYKEAGRTPSEQWYNLLRFLYFEKNDVPNTIAVLEELLVHYPNKQYWLQLSHMYGEKNDTARQTALMETAYVQGMLDAGTEFVTMAYLFLNSEVPYKAGKTVQDGLDKKVVEENSRNYEILGNAWRQAQEIDKSIPAMETAAAKSDSGELYARLGNVYLDADNFEKAIESINRGLSRGGVARVDQAQLALGMAFFNLQKYEDARKAFVEAAKDKRSAEYAKQWMSYMESEIERQRQLAQS
jgi:tetratricopeptide (TPR) repeat protein